ncbi:MAG: hypothetical protein ACF8OB_18735 [Phycisphaeraceae bacterium JB051]
MTQITSGFSSPFLILLLCLLATGSWLCFYALRRKRKGDQPHCRKCEYQLTGIATEQTHCPECGQSLTKPKAIVKGKRKTHTPLLLTGILLILITVSLSSHQAYQTVQSNGWLKLKPTSWLITDAVAEFNTQTRNSFPTKPTWDNTKELYIRLKDDTLSKNQLHTLVDHTIKLQLQHKVWRLNEDWKDILDELLIAKAFSQEQIERLITQNHSVELQCKPAIRRKRSFNCDSRDIEQDISRKLKLSFKETYCAIHFNDQLVKDLTTHSEQYDQYGPWSTTSGYTLELYKEPFKSAPNGNGKLSYQIKVMVNVDEPAIYQPFELALKTTKAIRLEPADAIVDNFITDDNFAKPVEDAWQQTRIQTTDDETKLWLDLNSLPIDLAMNVFIIDADKQIPFGGFIRHSNQDKRWELIRSSKKHSFSPNVHVELRPSQDVADRTKTLTDYWGKTMLRENITVNAPYSPPFNMDRSVVEAMTKAVSIRLSSRSKKHAVGIHFNFHKNPVDVAYVPMYWINGKWQSEKRYNRKTFSCPAQTRGSRGHGITHRVKPDQKTISIRLEPDIDWEGLTYNRVDCPWGYAIEFNDLPLPQIGDQRSDTRYTGKVILPDEDTHDNTVNE